MRGIIREITVEELFVEHTSCWLYDLCATDHHCGWVGGNAPEYFNDKQDLVNEAGMPYRFFMTFDSPVKDTMISIFLPNFETCVKHDVYPDCAIKVFQHKRSPESRLAFFQMYEPEPAEKTTDYQRNFDYSQPTMTKMFLSKPRLTPSPIDDEESYFLQVGGQPLLIQDEPRYVEKLEDDGYEFFASIDENGYRDGMIHGSYPLGFGALYLYAKPFSTYIVLIEPQRKY